mgnify:CR=1 FL=1
MSRFFIDRPIFAWVIAIIIMLAGVFSITSLPIEQYPELAPTQVSINANYPGASAATIEESVTQVIEQSMKGIDNQAYYRLVDGDPRPGRLVARVPRLAMLVNRGAPRDAHRQHRA